MPRFEILLKPTLSYSADSILSHPIPLPTSPLKVEEQDKNPLPFKGRARVGMGLAGNLTK
jgi:hypothetical protein